MRLLGRDHELDDVDRRLRAGRLVTVIGPGGVGKTALANEAAERAANRFALGSRTVDLTRVDDAEAVPGAARRAARLRVVPGVARRRPAIGKVLLLVDNCEHLLEAAALTIGRILEVCEQPTVLATSRSPLELPGESAWRARSRCRRSARPIRWHGRRWSCSSKRAPKPACTSSTPISMPSWICAAGWTGFRWRSRSPPHEHAR